MENFFSSKPEYFVILDRKINSSLRPGKCLTKSISFGSKVDLIACSAVDLIIVVSHCWRCQTFPTTCTLETQFMKEFSHSSHFFSIVHHKMASWTGISVSGSTWVCQRGFRCSTNNFSCLPSVSAKHTTANTISITLQSKRASVATAAINLTIFISQISAVNNLAAPNAFQTLFVPNLSSSKNLLSKVNRLFTSCTLGCCLTQFQSCLSIFYVCHGSSTIKL